MRKPSILSCNYGGSNVQTAMCKPMFEDVLKKHPLYNTAKPITFWSPKVVWKIWHVYVMALCFFLSRISICEVVFGQPPFDRHAEGVFLETDVTTWATCHVTSVWGLSWNQHSEYLISQAAKWASTNINHGNDFPM